MYIQVTQSHSHNTIMTKLPLHTPTRHRPYHQPIYRSTTNYPRYRTSTLPPRLPPPVQIDNLSHDRASQSLATLIYRRGIELFPIRRSYAYHLFFRLRVNCKLMIVHQTESLSPAAIGERSVTASTNVSHARHPREVEMYLTIPRSSR